jgi:hypothetical protein
MLIRLVAWLGGAIVLGAIGMMAGSIDQKNELHSVPQGDTSFIDTDVLHASPE